MLSPPPNPSSSGHPPPQNPTSVPFPTLTNLDESPLVPVPDHPKPPGLRSALKLPSISSASTPHFPQINQPTETALNGNEPTANLAGLTSPLPTPALSTAQSSPGFSSRPSFSRTRSTGEIILPPGYERRVGFSTMETKEPTKGGGTGAEYSFTLQAKSSSYKPRRDSRCFLVATDGESYSIQALDWLMSSLVEHGDEVVVLQVVEPGGLALKDFAVEKVEHAKTEAEEVLRHVLTKNDRQITVTVEFVIGPPIKTIQRMLEVYRPDSLVVGTRGKNTSAWQKAFSLSSTSQYLVARSPVPVIVVRPEAKVRQSREARAKDPKRQSYQALLGLPPKPSLAQLSINYESDGVTLRREQTNPL